MVSIDRKKGDFIKSLFKSEEPFINNSGLKIRGELEDRGILVTRAQLRDILDGAYDINDDSTWLKETIFTANTAY